MEIDMSLDDIIQKKGIRMNKSRKGGFRGRGFKRNENNNLRSNLKANGNFTQKLVGRGGLTKGGVGGGPNRRAGQIEDARLKIIQKTRLKITDAREKLVQKAKLGGDARLKLKKMQEKRLKSEQRQRKRGQPPLILRSVNPSIVEPTITIGDDSDEDDNDKMYSSWTTGSRSLTSRLMQQPPAQLKIVTHNEQLLQGRVQETWNYQLPASSLLNKQAAMKRQFGAPRSGYEEDDRFRGHRNSRISQEMKARLDTPVVPASRSMGVLAQLSTPASQPVGHRIVVSNLQPSVTHEDIKELFEDIGPLVTSHVVRPGTAEVIYVHQKDAVAAVDAYHNRQLDGQPMKCLLVPSRPNTLTSSARVGAKYPSSTKSAVLPDISAIHKALFNK